MSMVGEFNFNDDVWITARKRPGKILGVAFFTYMNPNLYVEYVKDDGAYAYEWLMPSHVTKIKPQVIPISGNNVTELRKKI